MASRPKQPSYNHTRGDSALTPCPLCAPKPKTLAEALKKIAALKRTIGSAVDECERLLHAQKQVAATVKVVEMERDEWKSAVEKREKELSAINDALTAERKQRVAYEDELRKAAGSLAAYSDAHGSLTVSECVALAVQALADLRAERDEARIARDDMRASFDAAHAALVHDRDDALARLATAQRSYSLHDITLQETCETEHAGRLYAERQREEAIREFHDAAEQRNVNYARSVELRRQLDAAVAFVAALVEDVERALAEEGPKS